MASGHMCYSRSSSVCCTRESTIPGTVCFSVMRFCCVGWFGPHECACWCFKNNKHLLVHDESCANVSFCGVCLVSSPPRLNFSTCVLCATAEEIRTRAVLNTKESWLCWMTFTPSHLIRWSFCRATKPSLADTHLFLKYTHSWLPC